jgi:hypothetical protein
VVKAFTWHWSSGSQRFYLTLTILTPKSGRVLTIPTPRSGKRFDYTSFQVRWQLWPLGLLGQVNALTIRTPRWKFSEEFEWSKLLPDIGVRVVKGFTWPRSSGSQSFTWPGNRLELLLPKLSRRVYATPHASTATRNQVRALSTGTHRSVVSLVYPNSQVVLKLIKVLIYITWTRISGSQSVNLTWEFS